MSEPIEVHQSSGTVFADLGLPDPEEALAKAELARQIGELIAQRGLSQVEAAKLLGLDQPKVSALMRGRLAGFSTDRLLRCLKALDCDVEIVIKRKPPSRQNARVRVITKIA